MIQQAPPHEKNRRNYDFTIKNGQIKKRVVNRRTAVSFAAHLVAGFQSQKEIKG
jgi:hypothetical protein